ncbi:MAG: nucleotidyl transferase AbiEii/AbiGii toxin family protein, partial [Caldimonas sp.]
MTTDQGASLLARLLNLAKKRGEDYNLLLNRFGLERLLCRVAASRYADRFLLKGALLFSLWYDEPHRPTRDADLLGFGPADIDSLVATFREIVGIELNDGVAFDSESVRAAAIREAAEYGGVRVRLNGRINNVRLALQIDVGFGDAVTPGPETAVLPAVLDDLEAPTLRVYPVYTVIAEKYHAMVVLGMANTRMKDFYDVAVIARRTSLDGGLLACAVRATFERRGTPLPQDLPVALTPEFGDSASKQQQWRGFLQKSRLSDAKLGETVALIASLLWPPTQVAFAGSPATALWDAPR